MNLEEAGLGETGTRDGALTGDDIHALILEAVENEYPFLLAIARPMGNGKADTICLPSRGTSMEKWASVVADAAAMGQAEPTGPKVVP